MKGLSKILILALIQIIERTSFYAIIGVLFLFMVSEEVGLPGEESEKLYSFFLKCVYFLPIVFGLLADLTNRRNIIFGGLGFMAVGYSLIYYLSGSIPGFYIGLGIAAFGISAYKPNILVLVGDIALARDENNRLALQGYILFGVLSSIGGFFAGFFPAYIRINYGYQILFITVSLTFIPAILLYYFLIYKTNLRKMSFQFHKNQILILIVIFLFSFLITYGFRIINFSINELIDFKAAEDLLEDPYSFDLFIELARNLAIVFAGLLGFGILFTKLVRVDLKSLVVFLTLGIGLTIVFFIYSNYNLINISTKSNGLYVIVVLIMSLLDILILPLVRYFIYMYSFRFKGLLFGLLIAQSAVISKYLISEDKKDNTLVFISIGLLILVIGLNMIYRQITESSGSQ